MTMERVKEVYQTLQLNGWTLSNPNEMYVVHQDQTITWELTHSSEKKLELEFYLFSHLGGRTNDLRDILYAKVAGCDEDKFYFHKIKSVEWHTTLQQLQMMLDKLLRHR